MSTRGSIGAAALSVPAMGLGCAPLAGLREPVSDAVAEATLQASWDCGVRYFDTSPWYGRGLSELRVGRFLREQPRQQFILSTKVGRTFHRPRDVHYRSEFWAGGLPFEHRFDYTYDGLMRSYDQSLARLGLNTIDLLLIHDLDIAEIGSQDLVEHHLRDLQRSGWRALETLRRDGEIKAIGAGVNIRGTIATLLPSFDIDFFLVAMPYTLLDQEILANEFQMCRERGVRIVIGSPFASGILATGSGAAQPMYNYVAATPDILEKTRRIEQVCKQHQVSLKAAAVQFPLLNPLVCSVLFGAIGAAQAKENARLFDVPIEPAFWLQLRDLRLIEPGSLEGLAR